MSTGTLNFEARREVIKFDHRPDRAERQDTAAGRRQDRRDSRRKAERLRREATTAAERENA